MTADIQIKCQLNISALDDLNAKYVTLLFGLKNIFEEEEERYPVPNIITGLCIADRHNLSFFSTERCLHSVKTIDEIFFYIGRECKYYDFTILKTFIDGSGCRKAKGLLEKYIKEIENSVISGLDLTPEILDICRQPLLTKQFEITCDKNELKVKELNLIIETVHKCLRLPRASILVKDVKNNCIILVCRIPSAVKDYLLWLKIIAYELKPLSVLKVMTLTIDDEWELKIPLDCDSEVNN